MRPAGSLCPAERPIQEPVMSNDRIPPGCADRESGTELADIHTIRERARRRIEDGAVTPSYGADRDLVVGLLNDALATELVCVLRYRRHYYTAEGIQAEAVKAEFLAHAKEEQAHADRLAARIVQLGGEPDFDPARLADRSHAEYREGRDLREMIIEDLVAERIAIESYTAMIRYLGSNDPTTRSLLEEILASEEQHAEDLSSLLKRV